MFEKKLYIASRKSIEHTDYGNEIEKFDNPKEYWFNYQPVNGTLDYQQYGANIRNIYRAFIDMSYLGKIKVRDRAYLIDGEIQDIKDRALNDNEYCEKANYRVIVVLPQNFKIRVDFEKIAKD